VLIPQMFDQSYFARRVQDLGVGAAITGAPTADSLSEALGVVLTSDVAERARHIGGEVRTDGTDVAAKLLMDAV
jgi:vancomycin aglycone glucosyltransferase